MVESTLLTNGVRAPARLMKIDSAVPAGGGWSGDGAPAAAEYRALVGEIRVRHGKQIDSAH
jgi:hypothetical protein